jgi:hypothetical protein
MGWVVSVTPRPRFSPRERTLDTHWLAGWVGLRAGLDTEARGKVFCVCRGSNPGRPLCSQTLYWLSDPARIEPERDKSGFALYGQSNCRRFHGTIFPIRLMLQSTDHEFIPAMNASLAAMQGSASGSNVRYYLTWKHSPLKEGNEQGCYNAYKLPDVCS